MRRTLAIIIAVVALSGTQALADGPYSLDAKGKCHDASGKFAKAALCKVPKHCRDPKSGHFAKCTAPGAVPS